MAREMRNAPHRPNTAVDESLRREAEALDRDQCGFCGAAYTIGRDDLEGVCPAHRHMAYSYTDDSGEF